MKASLATVAIALLLLGAGCSGDDGGDGGDDTSPDTTEEQAELSSYDTIAELNEALAAGGIECPLEYDGLRDDEKEQSICTIDGTQVFLTIWFDEGAVDAVIAPDGGDPLPGIVYGANWTIELTASTAELADSIAEAAGGASTGV